MNKDIFILFITYFFKKSFWMCNKTKQSWKSVNHKFVESSNTLFIYYFCVYVDEKKHNYTKVVFKTDKQEPSVKPKILLFHCFCCSLYINFVLRNIIFLFIHL